MKINTIGSRVRSWSKAFLVVGVVCSVVSCICSVASYIDMSSITSYGGITGGPITVYETSVCGFVAAVLSHVLMCAGVVFVSYLGRVLGTLVESLFEKHTGR